MNKQDLVLTEELTNDIIEKQDSKVVGVFMSLLAYKYIKMYGLTREQFLNSLNYSLDKLEKRDYKNE